MKFSPCLRFLFLEAQELLGNGVFLLKTRSKFERHLGKLAVGTQEVPVVRGFFMIGSSDGEQKSKA